MTLTNFLLDSGCALGLGLLIGLERQLGQHPAGVRTNGLVAAGAALYVLLGRSLVQGADAGKVAAQIVSGMGFLGGGVILREGLTVRGLTTAATLWCSAAVGALCGAELVIEGAIATAAILATNCLLNPVSRWINRLAAQRTYIDTSYRIKVVCAMADERRIRRMLSELIAGEQDMTLHGIGIHSSPSQIDEHGANRGLIVADVEMHVRDEHVLQDIVAKLNADPSTSSTSWERHA
jgi:putative Mg2+ transporter-C (MgtC) family protein